MAEDAEKTPEWRVTFWFLGSFGWTQLGFAHVKAENECKAIMLCVQRAVKLGFSVDMNTRAEVRAETDGRL